MVNAGSNKGSKCTKNLLSAQPPKVHLSPPSSRLRDHQRRKQGGKLRKESEVRKDQSKTTSPAHRRMIYP